MQGTTRKPANGLRRRSSAVVHRVVVVHWVQFFWWGNRKAVSDRLQPTSPAARPPTLSHDFVQVFHSERSSLSRAAYGCCRLCATPGSITVQCCSPAQSGRNNVVWLITRPCNNRLLQPATQRGFQEWEGTTVSREHCMEMGVTFFTDLCCCHDWREGVVPCTPKIK